MIGDSCGYLHKMDRNRMPICRYVCTMRACVVCLYASLGAFCARGAGMM